MRKISCAIFMGNPHAQKEIVDRIRFFDSLEISKVFNNQIEMIESLNQEQPNVLFVNVDQSRFNVLEVLKHVHRPPFMFAITNNRLQIPELLDNGFFDYLSPKLDMETFCKKVSKVLNIRNALTGENLFLAKEPETPYHRSTKKKNPTYVFLKYKKTQSKLAIEDIAVAINTAAGLKIETTKGKVYYHNSTLKKFGLQLPEDLFFRINKSVIVNVSQIDQVEQNTIYVRRKAFPVSRIFAPALRDFIRKHTFGKTGVLKKKLIIDNL
jgi:DNA-binding LytR/AlgR family response regulator